MGRYDTIDIPVIWLPELIQNDEYWDSISSWQTKDLNREYDMYMFNKSKQLFMQDYYLELVRSDNGIFNHHLEMITTGKIKQTFDDTITCVAKPGFIYYEIKLTITKGVLTDIKIMKAINYKREL